MAKFNYKIIHQKGSKNGRANVMSWRPDYNTGQPIIYRQVFKIQDDGIMEQ